MERGYVYLLLCIESDGVEHHKIGITKNEPSKRIKQLQTGSANKITLLRAYKTKNYLKVERWMHRKYFGSKTEAKNEWRKLTDEQVFAFVKDCEEADDNINFLLENNSLFD
jgi:hypothetical protein